MITTNNGSFPWRGLPLGEAWRQAQEAARDGADHSARLKEARDRLTRQAIEAQAAAGCDLPTDGRVGRDDPGASTIAGLAGVEAGPERAGYPAGGRGFKVPVVRGEVSWKGALVAEDHLFAAQGAGRPVKPILTGPYTLALIAEDHAYGDPMALAMALAAALNQELRALQASGASVIQVDEPAILGPAADFPIFTRVWEVLGRGVQSTMVLHLEGGDIQGVWPGLLRLKRLGCLSVDCVTVPGNLDLLQSEASPEGLSLGLGLVGGLDDGRETAEAVAGRVRRASALPPAARLVLGTGPDLGRLDTATAVARLRALDGARRLIAAG
jgi:5-methyltetrahydropteroyltriglutamate--homocysteine methyltransferase